MAATVRRALSFGSRSKRQPVDTPPHQLFKVGKVADIDVVAAEGESAGAAEPPPAADEPAAAPPASLAPAPVAAAAPKASATSIVRRALSFGSISSSKRAREKISLQPTPGGPLVPPLKLGTSNPWPDASDDDSEEDSEDEPLDAPAGIRGRSASESSPPAPRGTRITVVATKVMDEDEDVAERGATAAVRLVSCAAIAAKSAPAHRRNPWQSEAISGSSEAISGSSEAIIGSMRVHLELSLCRQAAADEPNVATDSTGVRVVLRLVTMSAVPSAMRYTFPYAAPLGMYLAQRDGFVIVETVIPSMQAAEAGVVPGAIVLSMHRRSGEDAIWMDLAGMLRDEIIAEIEQVPPLTMKASDGL